MQQHQTAWENSRPGRMKRTGGPLTIEQPSMRAGSTPKRGMRLCATMVIITGLSRQNGTHKKDQRDPFTLCGQPKKRGKLIMLGKCQGRKVQHRRNQVSR